MENKTRTQPIKTGVHLPPSGSWFIRPLVKRRSSDYPEISRARLNVALNYSAPLLLGPPLCDEFIKLIVHMFSEEEADVARYLKPLSLRTASQIAQSAARPVEEVRVILERLAREKCILLYQGDAENRKYALLPIMPGTFEHVLMRTDLGTLTDWHREFMRLFEELYDTGYSTVYHGRPLPGVRYLPVNQSVLDTSTGDPLGCAWPSDRLPEVLERYKFFAVGLCQCRMTTRHLGQGCDRPLEVCAVFGEWAVKLVNEGRMRRVTKEELLEIKSRAEAAGLVSWMMNEESGKKVGVSCSCCGCCCHALRTISEFNTPGMIAPGHFKPEINIQLCKFCGKCMKACPMAALIVEKEASRFVHLPQRCIGCGLCSAACDKQKALSMIPKQGYQKPPSTWISLLLKLAPNYLANAFQAWTRYR